MLGRYWKWGNGVHKRIVDTDESHDKEIEAGCPVSSGSGLAGADTCEPEVVQRLSTLKMGHRLNKLTMRKNKSGDVTTALAFDDLTGMELDAGMVKEARDKEVGYLESQEVKNAKELLDKYGKKVSNICHHIFAGMRMDEKPGGELHNSHLDRLKRCMEIAHELGSPCVRILSPKKRTDSFWCAWC